MIAIGFPAAAASLLAACAGMEAAGNSGKRVACGVIRAATAGGGY